MLKITLENGSAYEVLPETACYPSMSTTARSHLEIHTEKTFALEIPVEHFGKFDFHVGEYISDQFVRFWHFSLVGN